MDENDRVKHQQRLSSSWPRFEAGKRDDRSIHSKSYQTLFLNAFGQPCMPAYQKAVA